MELLYEAEAKEIPATDVVAALPAPPLTFAVEVIIGVTEHIDEIDGWITRQSHDWSLERMPAVDRALLRMAIFELIHRVDVPTAVVIAEAVELAQQFSTDDSSRFVNGMLAAVAREVRPLAGDIEVPEAPAVVASPTE